MTKVKGKFGISGRVKLTCHKKDGSLKWSTGWMENVITNTGLAEFIKLSGHNLGGTRFQYLAVGSGTTDEDATQTALVTEISDGGLARAEATVTSETDTVDDDTLKLVHSWTATATRTVEEIGFFNDASAGTMGGRKLTGTKEVDEDEVLTGEYEVVAS